MRVARHPSRLTPLAALIAVLALALAPPAGADIGETIVDRCTHGESLSGFSQSDYAKALKALEAGTEEYSDCSSLIRQAQVAAASAGRGGGITGSRGLAAAPRSAAVAASPAEQQSIAHAAQSPSAPVQLGGQAIEPGVVHTNVSSALNSLPTPLLISVVFVLVCLLALAGGTLRNRIRSRQPS
jgi:hypothetical protein